MKVEVHPSQLVPQSVITHDVFSKTNHPIIAKDTVVDDIHICILKQFLIDKVEVAPKLANGAPFHPKEKQQVAKPKKKKKADPLPIVKHYQQVVEAYKKMFEHWQSGAPVQIYQVRELMVPLLERVETFGSAILELHRYSSKHDYFYHHSVAISLLAGCIAKRLRYTNEWVQVGIAAFLAESGMAKISRPIFYKKGLLTEAEFQEIKKHPTYSYRYVEKTPTLTKGAKLAILQHHERLDGTGYPLGVKGDRIHPFAKIIAVCDTYHAMTAARYYRDQQSPFKVMEQMEQEVYQKFDYKILYALLHILTDLSLGTKVKLSDQTIAEIVYTEKKHPTRPIVRLESGEMISLKEKKSLYIDAILTTKD